MGWFTKQEDEDKGEKEEKRKQILLNELNKYRYVGVLNDCWVRYSDFDYFYENGWELIATSSRYYSVEKFFFKRRKVGE